MPTLRPSNKLLSRLVSGCFKIGLASGLECFLLLGHGGQKRPRVSRQEGESMRLDVPEDMLPRKYILVFDLFTTWSYLILLPC